MAFLHANTRYQHVAKQLDIPVHVVEQLDTYFDIQLNTDDLPEDAMTRLTWIVECLEQGDTLDSIHARLNNNTWSTPATSHLAPTEILQDDMLPYPQPKAYQSFWEGEDIALAAPSKQFKYTTPFKIASASSELESDRLSPEEIEAHLQQQAQHRYPLNPYTKKLNALSPQPVLELPTRPQHRAPSFHVQSPQITYLPAWQQPPSQQRRFRGYPQPTR